MDFPALSSAMSYILRLLDKSIVEANPTRSDKVETAREELASLYEDLDKYKEILAGRILRVDPLEDEIEAAQDKFLQRIEAHISSLGRFLSNSETGSRTLDDEVIDDYASVLSEELRGIRQEISSLTKKLEQLLDSREEIDNKQPEVSLEYHTGHRESSKLIVGLEDELRQLIDMILTDNYSGYPYYGSDTKNMISIVGMPGIGKTTLILQIFDHPSISSYFDIQIMMTIGPSLNYRDVLLQVLHLVGVGTVGMLEKLGEDELKDHLIKFLEGRKWLIVFDDLWFHDDMLDNLSDILKLYKGKGHIIFTTQLHGLGRRNHCIKYEKHFLSDEDSWDLLHGIVFTHPEEVCPPQLEKIGKQIAKNCEGLPLAIVLVAKLLCQNEKTKEYWRKILEDENPLNIGIYDNSPISKSLYLSYHMLFEYQKTGFLYAGVFPKSYMIYSSNLIRLWAIEGFIKPIVLSIAESAANWLLDELVYRSVILAQANRSRNSDYKTCRVHTVFRNLCISVAQKEGFCHVIKKCADRLSQGAIRQPRLCIHNNVVLGIKEVRTTLKSMSSLRTFLCFGPQHMYPLHIDFTFKLLRIIDALRIRFYMFPDQVLESVRLRYLAMTYDGQLPKSISKLSKLQVLNVGRHWNIQSSDAPSYLPAEIWELKWLRHLQCTGNDLPDHCTSRDGCDDCPMLKYLITLSGVSSRSCTQRTLARMPSLEKLAIRIMLAPDEVEKFNFFGDVAQQLQQLRSFKCLVSGLKSQIIPASIPIFPSAITKITLSGCRFPWEYMTSIAKLPNLRSLKLQCHAFCGSVWKSRSNEFRLLQYLLLEDLDIEEWKARPYHFSALNHLIIRHCYRLHELPNSTMEYMFLLTVTVEDCSPAVNKWAKQIKGRLKNCPVTHISSSFDEDHLESPSEQRS